MSSVLYLRYLFTVKYNNKNILPVQEEEGQYRSLLNPMTGINTFIEIASHLTDGLIFLYRSYRGVSIKLRMFHNQLKTPCSTCKGPVNTWL